MKLELLEYPLPGGSVTDWGVALGLSAILVLAVALLKPVLIRRVAAIAARTQTTVDDALLDALKSTKLWLMAVLAVSLGARYLHLTEKAGAFLNAAMTLALFLQAGLWLGALLNFWLKRSQAKALTADPGAATSLSALGFLARLALWVVILLLVLDNLGVNITALVAGLGIGGVAVALAVQNILGDLFASLSIVIDKPFVIGDFIIVDDYMGSVEHIGLKTTRIRSLGGEQIIFSNSDLLKTRVRNYKRMYERRVVFTFKLPYDTPLEKIELVPSVVRKIIEAQKKVRFDRAHFFKFGDSTLDFEVVFWVLDADYNLYMDIQQSINLAVLRELARLQLRLAFPTYTIQAAGLQHAERRQAPPQEPHSFPT